MTAQGQNIDKEDSFSLQLKVQCCEKLGEISKEALQWSSRVLKSRKLMAIFSVFMVCLGAGAVR